MKVGGNKKSIEIALNIPFKNRMKEDELLRIIKNKIIEDKWEEHIEYLFTEVSSELFLKWCYRNNISLNDLKIFYEKCLKNRIDKSWITELWKI